jgi:hypothetical protein
VRDETVRQVLRRIAADPGEVPEELRTELLKALVPKVWAVYRRVRSLNPRDSANPYTLRETPLVGVCSSLDEVERLHAQPEWGFQRVVYADPEDETAANMDPTWMAEKGPRYSEIFAKAFDWNGPGDDPFAPLVVEAEIYRPGEDLNGDHWSPELMTPDIL